jgi:hypothetical protein
MFTQTASRICWRLSAHLTISHLRRSRVPASPWTNSGRHRLHAPATYKRSRLSGVHFLISLQLAVFITSLRSQNEGLWNGKVADHGLRESGRVLLA